MDTVTTPLYQRLGGRDGITRISRDLIAAHLANPLIRTRFEKVDDPARLERRVIEFFCMGAGGPETYSGRDMVATHRGMNVSEQEFVAAIDDAMAVLEKHGIDAATRHEVLGILWGFKPEVVRV